MDGVEGEREGEEWELGGLICAENWIVLGVS